MRQPPAHHAQNSTPVPHVEFAGRVVALTEAGRRVGLLTARRSGGGNLSLVAVMLSPSAGEPEIIESALPAGCQSYDSLTRLIPSVHWYERFIYDLFGLVPTGHPRFKSVIFHEAWPDGYFPLTAEEDVLPQVRTRPGNFGFLPVHGDGVFEIPVGPIHAGIIEPGHFRFSCFGEVIQNLDIRLGYVHRGIERRLENCAPNRARMLAEAASTDTCAANALAHALAIEDLLGKDMLGKDMPGIEPVPADRHLRLIALEFERVACHTGDLGGICADIGFLAGAALFGRLRGRILGLAERLAGSRFLTAYIRPGGVARPLDDRTAHFLHDEVWAVSQAFRELMPVLLDNYGALERMEGIGRLTPTRARDLGIIGPAGRASGVRYDVREHQATYRELEWRPVYLDDGDINARVRVRAWEVEQSLALLLRLLAGSFEGSGRAVAQLGALPPNRVGVGVVEAWRGELIHLIFTGENGEITRYAIKDPSVNNWSGLANAVRGELVSDFPICNKSFGLSYSGNDL